MLVIASRGSQLALWQARWVSAQLTALGHECRIEIIKTTGDKITDVPLAKVGTKGLFTKEIEEALLDGRADLAVHSLKDLPTELPEGLVLAAVPEREDPRDAVVGKRLADLPKGAKVGTSSLRRSAQLRKLRPDLAIESVRGESRHATAQARRRPVRRDSAGGRGIEEVGLGRSHRRNPVGGDDVLGGGARRVGDRDAHQRRRLRRGPGDGSRGHACRCAG